MIRFIAVLLPFAILLLVPARADAQACAPNSCDKNAICTRTGPTAFSCTCRAGYTGDGRTCVEIDACASDPCNKNAICSKTGAGTFSCTCKAGYSGNGITCLETDACASDPCDKNASCARTGPGTFSCTCKAGYSGDGRTCRNIVVTQPSAVTIPPRPASPSAFATVDLGRSVTPSVYAPVGSEVRAFIGTGSTGPVIGSLSECSPCNITFSAFAPLNFGGQEGVLITVIFSAPTPANQGLKVTFQQQGLTSTSVIKAPIYYGP